MARITVEDCTKVVGNRFHLVLIAAQRTKDMLFESKDSEEEKDTIIALRQIASGEVDVNIIEEELIRKQRKYSEKSYNMIYNIDQGKANKKARSNFAVEDEIIDVVSDNEDELFEVSTTSSIKEDNDDENSFTEVDEEENIDDDIENDSEEFKQDSSQIRTKTSADEDSDKNSGKKKVKLNPKAEHRVSNVDLVYADVASED